MQCLREHGPDVSMDDLAAAAGVSKPVLYDEFGGKLGIADAIAVVLAEDVERQAIEAVTRREGFDIEVVIRTVIDAIADVMVDEPELYAFLVRSLRASDRGFLDNALVRVVDERAAVVIGLVAPDVPDEHVAVLTDGLFGFVFGAVESWHERREPSREELARSLTIVIRRGIEAIADELSS